MIGYRFEIGGGWMDHCQLITLFVRAVSLRASEEVRAGANTINKLSNSYFLASYLGF